MNEAETRREVRSEALRRNLRHLLNSVERDGAHVTIKRYKEPTAVIVPVAWYERASALVSEKDGKGH